MHPFVQGQSHGFLAGIEIAEFARVARQIIKLGFGGIDVFIAADAQTAHRGAADVTGIGGFTINLAVLRRGIFV